MIKDLELEPLASRRKHARLCTMYKIANHIIHVNKSKYLIPATETRTRGSRGFEYLIKQVVQVCNDVFEYSFFLEQ